MSEETVIKVCELGGGLSATVKDCTRHYFGGYYHVRILVRADIPIQPSSFDATADYDDAVVRLGHSVSFSRTLEKMAVPEDEIQLVRQQLVAAFDANVLPYMVREDFAPSFVRSEYRKKLSTVPQSCRYS